MSKKSRTRQSSTSHRILGIETLEDRHMLSGAPNADFDGSGMIDNTDLGIWQTGFAAGTTQTQGDADNDSDVDGADFLQWQRTNGQAAPAAACIDISIDGLLDNVEDTPGAIIFRNSDFSKQTLAAVQPEAGETLFLPDHSAPSTVFDPNAATDFTTATVTIDPSMVGNYQVQFTFDDLQIDLWTTSTWAGLDPIGGGRSKIRSSINVVPTSNTITFQIEGIDASTAFATDTIQVEAIPNGGGATLTDSGSYTVVDTGVGVDGNRDGLIDFASNHDRQLLFWLNNDQEGQHVTDPVEFEHPDITTPDNTDGVIGQQRDLEDLAPLRLNVDPLLVTNLYNTTLPDPVPAGLIQSTYRILLEDPAGASIRLFRGVSSNIDALEHVNNTTIASSQVSNTFKQALGASFSDSQEVGLFLPGTNSLLFEAIGTAYGVNITSVPTLIFETTIKYLDGTTRTKRHEVDLDLRDIKQLYTRYDVNFMSGSNDLREDLSFEHFVTPTIPTHSSQAKNIPFLSGDDTIFLVHGWNMPDTVDNDWKAAFSETAFKRLYWQGFRGEFVSFNWPTFADEEGPREWPLLGDAANITYNPSEFQAYRSARALKEVLATFRGEAPNLQPVHLLAHSMGNVVAGEALRQWTFDVPFNDDPLVTNYVAMEAAVSSGAYGSNDQDALPVGRPIPDLYRFWSHGRDGFSDPGLGIVEYFQSSFFAAENTVNLYNAADFALNLWDLNNLSKNLHIQSPVWNFDYEFTAGDGENVNNDIFDRVPDGGGATTTLTALTLPNGRPGRDAYEILAFFSESASLAVGTKIVNRFDTNINFAATGLQGGNGLRANHSFQFGHDSADTWTFWDTIKNQTGFGTTLPLVASVEEFTEIATTGIPAIFSLSQPRTQVDRQRTNSRHSDAVDQSFIDYGDGVLRSDALPQTLASNTMQRRSTPSPLLNDPNVPYAFHEDLDAYFDTFDEGIHSLL